jgi:hypothetical protein
MEYSVSFLKYISLTPNSKIIHHTAKQSISIVTTIAYYYLLYCEQSNNLLIQMNVNIL